jgi:hypothetical protein
MGILRAIRRLDELVLVMATSSSPLWAALLYVAGMYDPLLAKLRSLGGAAQQ